MPYSLCQIDVYNGTTGNGRSFRIDTEDSCVAAIQESMRHTSSVSVIEVVVQPEDISESLADFGREAK